MKALKSDLGRVRLKDFTRERLIEYGKRRARDGAGPVTLSIDLDYIRTVVVHAAATRPRAADYRDLGRSGIRTSAHEYRDFGRNP